MKQYTLITGGASGLGFSLSKLFAKDGNNLFLISYNLNNLSAAKEQIEKEYNVEVHILALDLSNPQNFPKIKEYTDSHEMHINNLINCAGFGDQHDFKDMDINLQLKMIELNCNCPLYLMNTYINGMIKENSGHIMNIGSLASFFPGPYMVTYHASKAFLLNISEGIERELKGTNVKMTVICPGPFTSGFVAKAGNTYAFEKIKPLSCDKVADISYKAFKKNKSLRVIGFGNKMSIFFSRFFPRKFVTNQAAKTLKKDA